MPKRLAKNDLTKKVGKREDGRECKERVRLYTRCCCCYDDEMYFIFLSGSIEPVSVSLAVFASAGELLAIFYFFHPDLCVNLKQKLKFYEFDYTFFIPNIILTPAKKIIKNIVKFISKLKSKKSKKRN